MSISFFDRGAVSFDEAVYLEYGVHSSSLVLGDKLQSDVSRVSTRRGGYFCTRARGWIRGRFVGACPNSKFQLQSKFQFQLTKVREEFEKRYGGP
jgi:hypothetical protein